MFLNKSLVVNLQCKKYSGTIHKQKPRAIMWQVKEAYINDLVQDCSISIANALEILQSCTKSSMSKMVVCAVSETFHVPSSSLSIWWQSSTCWPMWLTSPQFPHQRSSGYPQWQWWVGAFSNFCPSSNIVVMSHEAQITGSLTLCSTAPQRVSVAESIPIMKIRWSWDFIFIIGIPVFVTLHFYIEMVPVALQCFVNNFSSIHFNYSKKDFFFQILGKVFFLSYTSKNNL